MLGCFLEVIDMEKLKMLVFIIIGNLLLAISVSAFILPNHFIAGGATGLALILNHYTMFSVSICVMIINAIFFCIGYVFLGRKFAFSTIISTIIYPFLLNICSSITIFQDINDDVFLSSVLAGILMGIGIGLVIKAGASTGGLDIPLLILNKKKNIPVGKSMYVMDTCLLLLQASFSSMQDIVYGIIIVLVTSTVINQVLLSGEKQIQIFVISKAYQKIKDELLHGLDTGVTLVNIETGMDGNRQKGVLTICSKRKIESIKKMILEIDPTSFMMINSVVEVHGKGYTMQR